MTVRASPLHQLTTRRGPNHCMYAYKDFYGGKSHIPTLEGTPLYKPYRHVPPQWVGFLRCFGLKMGQILPILVWN